MSLVTINVRASGPLLHLRRATQNLLRAFAAGPAGRAHPARDNLAQVKPPRIPSLYDGVD